VLKESVCQYGENCDEAHELRVITGHAIALFPWISRSRLPNEVLENHIQKLVGE